MPTQSEASQQLKAQLDGNGLGFFLDNIRTLAIVLDPQGAVIGWNAAFEVLRNACQGASSLPEFLSAGARTEFIGSLRDVMESGTPARVQLELASPAGRSRYDCFLVARPNDRLLFIGEPVGGDGQGEGHLRALVEELERLKVELGETKQALEAKKQELQAVLVQADEVSHTDALTFLPNRRSIIASLQHEVNRSERYGFPLSISMIDIDNFKEINDTRGHTIGDQVLRFIASEMRDHIRQPDEIGRYGGDEFLVVLPDTTENAASEQANRLCKQILATPVQAGKDQVSVSVSIGIAQYRPKEDDWHTLLNRADKALYQAKHNGRGRWALVKG